MECYKKVTIFWVTYFQNKRNNECNNEETICLPEQLIL